MSKHLQRALDSLEQELLAMSSVVETMIDKTCRSLIESKLDLAAEVIQTDADVDQREVFIEEECLRILALYQPVASDLRRATTVMKVNVELERIADLAVNIAQRAERLILYPGVNVPPKIERMADVGRRMLRQSLDSFVKQDIDEAQNVCLQDDEVDALYEEVIAELKAEIAQRPDMVEPLLLLFSASKSLERIADLATNIAEDVIYLVGGEIARHKRTEF